MNHDRFWTLLAKRLSGEATPEEEAELAAMVKAAPELSYAAQHVTDLWKLSPALDVRDSQEAFQKHLALLTAQDASTRNPLPNDSLSAPPPHRPKMTRKLYAAVAVCLLLVGAWVVWPSNEKPATPTASEVSTRPGSRTKLILPDSSVVWLNAGSRLTYDRGFGAANRTTQLTGEAFFDVKRGNLPFVIHTSGVRIKVLGTAFNVKSYPEERKTETSLVRGEVEITVNNRPGEMWKLKPNEKLTVANGSTKAPAGAAKKGPMIVLHSLTRVDEGLIAETSWVENKLVFHDETLGEVARKLERWYNVTISIKDDALAELRVGGGPFENETVKEALEALQIAFNFKFSINGNFIQITR